MLSKSQQVYIHLKVLDDVTCLSLMAIFCKARLHFGNSQVGFVYHRQRNSEQSIRQHR